MSQYDPRGWPGAPGPNAWEGQAPSTRPAGGPPAAPPHEELSAFSTQIEEVDRAMDNLLKSGKMFAMPGRRDSMPIMGGSRGFADYDPRLGGPNMQRHHSVSEFDPTRPHPGSNLQNYYAHQRFQPRPSEAEQMLQQKRRMAAQRERELRNYHQEQQYNRSLLAEMSAQGKPDRAMSPSAMSEEERRELIARQHRALYSREGSAVVENGGFGPEGLPARTMATQQGPMLPTVTGPSTVAGRGPSPLGLDQYRMGAPGNSQGSRSGVGPTDKDVSAPAPSEHPTQSSGPASAPPAQRSRANSNASPTSNNNNNFSLFENGHKNNGGNNGGNAGSQQVNRTSASSPSGSPPRQGSSKFPGASSSVAPIGTRPSPVGPSAVSNNALNKQRSTTPLPSPLSYGFGTGEDAPATSAANERSTSAASNPTAGGNQESNVSLGWGSKSGVWGNKSSLGVQASVWG